MARQSDKGAREARSTPTGSRSRAHRPAALRAFRPVRLATLVDTVAAGSGWLHEMKYDGYRLLLAIGGGAARADARSGLDWSDRFGPLLAEAARLDISSALIDGEAVALGADGRSNFQSMQKCAQSLSRGDRLIRLRPDRAAPVGWREMETIDAPSHFHVGDAPTLVKRAGSKALAARDRAAQELPDL